MQTWKEHLTRKHCPWAITLDNKTHILWKIDERLNPEEAEAERKNLNVRWFRESNGDMYNLT